MILIKTNRRFGKVVCKSQIDGIPLRELTIEQFKRLLSSGGEYHLITPKEHSDDYEKAKDMIEQYELKNNK